MKAHLPFDRAFNFFKMSFGSLCKFRTSLATGIARFLERDIIDENTQDTTILHASLIIAIFMKSNLDRRLVGVLVTTFHQRLPNIYTEK